MAKSVLEAVRHRDTQPEPRGAVRPAAVGRNVLGFKKDYAQDELDRIAMERTAMRERLLADG